MLGRLPRVAASTKGEGHERRYFYGSVWAVCLAQPALGILWKLLPRTRVADSVKLAVFVGILAFVGNLARLGRLPRTRPIVPGESAIEITRSSRRLSMTGSLNTRPVRSSPRRSSLAFASTTYKRPALKYAE